MTTSTEYDVVVVGSGPAGSATALQLARAGWRVLVLEKRHAPRVAIGETIAPAAKRLVTGLLGSLPQHLPEWACHVQGTQSIWGSAEPQTHDYFFGPYGPGLCVNRTGFDEAIRNTASTNGADYQNCAELSSTDYSKKDAHWHLTTTGSQSVTAKFLVDATGRRGAVAKLLGQQREQSDPLFSFALHVFDKNAGTTTPLTRIEATEYGWWYSNLLPAKDSSEPASRIVVLHTDPGCREAILAKSVSGFTELLSHTQLMREVAGPPVGKIRGAPAGNARASSIVRDGFLAVGDAAQAFDPLSSQGIQQALSSGIRAGHALGFALANRDSSAAYLERYAQTMDDAWLRFMTEYQKYYRLEARWPHSAFWQSRHCLSDFSQPLNARDVS